MSLLQAVNDLINREKEDVDKKTKSDQTVNQLLNTRPRLDVSSVINLVNKQTGAMPVERRQTHQRMDSPPREKKSDQERDIMQQIEADEQLAIRLAREMDSQSSFIVPTFRGIVNEPSPVDDGSPIWRFFQSDTEKEEWFEWLESHGVPHSGHRDVAHLLQEFYQIKAGRIRCKCGQTSEELGLIA